MKWLAVGNVETRVLRGHYLTRSEAAQRAGVSTAELHPRFGGASIIEELRTGCGADSVIAALRAA